MSAAEAPIIRERDGALAILALNNPVKLRYYCSNPPDRASALKWKWRSPNSSSIMLRRR